jgi:hypothetical protein
MRSLLMLAHLLAVRAVANNVAAGANNVAAGARVLCG